MATGSAGFVLAASSSPRPTPMPKPASTEPMQRSPARHPPPFARLQRTPSRHTRCRSSHSVVTPPRGTSLSSATNQPAPIPARSTHHETTPTRRLPTATSAALGVPADSNQSATRRSQPVLAPPAYRYGSSRGEGHEAHAAGHRPIAMQRPTQMVRHADRRRPAQDTRASSPAQVTRAVSPPANLPPPPRPNQGRPQPKLGGRSARVTRPDGHRRGHKHRQSASSHKDPR
jgi:hypothetical protein